MPEFEPGNQQGLSTRFQPGTSGNPAGYPEGVPNRGTLLRKMLAKEIDYKDPSTGEFVRGTIEDAVTLAQLAKASEGDTNAYREIMDSVWGRQSTDITTKGEKLPSGPAVFHLIPASDRPVDERDPEE